MVVLVSAVLILDVYSKVPASEFARRGSLCEVHMAVSVHWGACMKMAYSEGVLSKSDRCIKRFSVLIHVHQNWVKSRDVRLLVAVCKMSIRARYGTVDKINLVF